MENNFWDEAACKSDFTMVVVVPGPPSHVGGQKLKENKSCPPFYSCFVISIYGSNYKLTRERVNLVIALSEGQSAWNVLEWVTQEASKVS